MTCQDVREMQLAAIDDVERQLRTDVARIEIAGHHVSREAAWAATKSIRSCWRRGLRYDGQWKAADGRWWSQGVHGASDAVEVECLGRFPEELVPS